MSAVQHDQAPRPLPLFLELVRLTAEREPELGATRSGLRAYAAAARPVPVVPRLKSPAWGQRAARSRRLRPAGGADPVADQPPYFSISTQRSRWPRDCREGRRALLLDWGEARDRGSLSRSAHSRRCCCLAARARRAAALIGYCLGWTRLSRRPIWRWPSGWVTLAAPWRFTAYPADSRTSLQAMWREPRRRPLAWCLPMESCKRRSGRSIPTAPSPSSPSSPISTRTAPSAPLVQLEDWANQGSLALAGRRRMIEDFVRRRHVRHRRLAHRRPGHHRRPQGPVVHFTAAQDRIATAATAPAGYTVEIPSGLSA